MVEPFRIVSYGDGPEITRIEGRGNGGNVLQLTEESEADVVANFTRQKKSLMPEVQGQLMLRLLTH